MDAAEGFTEQVVIGAVDNHPQRAEILALFTSCSAGRWRSGYPQLRRSTTSTRRVTSTRDVTHTAGGKLGGFWWFPRSWSLLNCPSPGKRDVLNFPAAWVLLKTSLSEAPQFHPKGWGKELVVFLWKTRRKNSAPVFQRGGPARPHVCLGAWQAPAPHAAAHRRGVCCTRCIAAGRSAEKGSSWSHGGGVTSSLRSWAGLLGRETPQGLAKPVRYN